jgi:hypothetical protein
MHRRYAILWFRNYNPKTDVLWPYIRLLMILFLLPAVGAFLGVLLWFVLCSVWPLLLTFVCLSLYVIFFCFWYLLRQS